MSEPIYMPEERTISIPSTRVYEAEQKDVFATLLLLSDMFGRAKIVCYNLLYDTKYLDAEKLNSTKFLKDWTRENLGCQFPDYYITSIQNKSSGILRAQNELFRTQDNDRKQVLQTRQDKLKSMETKLENLTKMKKELVSASKENRTPKIMYVYKKWFESIKKSDGTEPRDVKERTYLFECAIDQKIKRTKANIGQIQFKIHRSEQIKPELPSRITFGSKALYKKKDTCDLPNWRMQWRDARTSSIYFAGRHNSKDCNFLVRYDANQHELKIRLPWKEENRMQELTIKELYFPYQGDLLKKALDAPPKSRRSVSYEIHFRRDHKGRRYFLVRANFVVETVLNYSMSDGVVGVDCNLDNFAVANISADGNVLSTKTIPFSILEASSGQTDDIIGRAVSEVVQYAEELHKPIVMEDLDLAKKRASLAYGAKKHNRYVSAFAYNKMASHMEGICFKRNVGLIKVDPAYTSMIGKVKYLMHNQKALHESAAIAIGRRGLGCQDKVPSYLKNLLTKKTKTAPLYKQWRYLYKKLKEVPLSEFRKRQPVLTRKDLTNLKTPSYA